MRLPGGTVAKVSTAAIVLLVVGANVYFTNLLVERNQPAISIVPGSPLQGDKGEKGDKGDRPTAQEIQQVVDNYCASTGRCEGKSPSAETVYALVAKFCENNACRGDVGAAGSDGRDATPITAAQIQAQVSAYCASNQCVGADGINGADGIQGVPGEAGPPPVMACVIRSSETVDDERFVAWKYSFEPDTAYRNIYKLPPPSPSPIATYDCDNPIDLRGNA